MSGTPVFSRPVSRSIHRAVLVTLALVLAASIDARALRAQGTPPSGQDGSSMRQRRPMQMGMAVRGHRGMMRMMSDPAARLLDEQSMLQLSGAQVTQLISLHESTRKEMKAVTDQLRAMMPRLQGQNQGQGQAQGQRPQLTQAQRDNLATLMDSLRTIRWRATSAADSVLTTDQRHAAVRLEMDRRNRMRRGFAGGRGFGAGGGMRRMEPGGLGGPGGMRAPNDSGPSDE